MGDYPSDIQVATTGKRLFVPVRGQNYLLWADIVSQGEGKLDLRCNNNLDTGCDDTSDPASCKAWDCDGEHRVNFSEDRHRSLPAEPFGLYLNEVAAVYVDQDGSRHTCRDGFSQVGCSCKNVPRCSSPGNRECCIDPPGGDHVYVTHLSGGEISFFTSDVGEVRLRDIHNSFFNPSGDIRGGFSLAAQIPGDAEGSVYVSSRVDKLLASFVIRDNQRIVDAEQKSLEALTPGTDVRGIAFSPGGERLYLVDRQPPTLVALDMTPKDDGGPQQDPIWVTEVCSEPATLRLAANPTRPDNPQAQLAYVVCFRGAQIYVVDTLLGKVVDQISTGSGPSGLVLDTKQQRAFVTNFLENTVGVIDLNPANASYHRMVLRIGFSENLVHN